MKRKILLAVALVFLVSAAAAQPANSTSEVKPGLTPGSFLYPVENFVESLEVRMAGLVGGPDLKAKAIANNAEERLAEARELSERNRTEKASEMVEKYSEAMNRSRELASRGEDEKLKQKLDNVTARNVKTLEEVKKKVPEEARKGIQNAIDQSKRKKAPGIEKPGATPAPENPPGKVKPRKPETPSQGKPDRKVPGNLTEGPEAENRSAPIPGNETPGNVTPGNSGNATGSEIPENRRPGMDGEPATPREDEEGSTGNPHENSSESGNGSSSPAEKFLSNYEDTGSEVDEEAEVDQEEEKISGGR
jgi:hypothetical protein